MIQWEINMLSSYKNFKNNSEIPTDYSINLMWINKKLNEDNPYIDNSQSEEDLIQNFLIKAKYWEDSNPEAEINIWFDSQFVSEKALKATQEVLSKISGNIKLRDIREIELVKNNSDVFSDYIPVYFRIDILKLIICLHSILEESKEAAIFTDLLVGDRRDFTQQTPRMTKAELFSLEIMEILNNIGILSNDMENQFFQVMNKPESIEAIKAFINVNLLRAIHALNLLADVETVEKLTRKKEVVTDLSEVLAATMHTQLYPLVVGNMRKENLINAKFFDETAADEWVPYDFVKHGYLPLGNLAVSRNLTIPFVHNEKGCTAFNKNIKLGQVSDVKYSRNVDVKAGSGHSEDIEKLVERMPHDGSDIYKCQFINTAESKQKKILSSK